MQSGTIVHRKAGTFPPNAYWEKVISANGTGWGAVTLSEVDGSKFLELSSEAATMTLESIQDTLKSFPNQDITFYFCQSETAVSLKDISPYVLICKPSEEDPEQEEPMIVGFIEGNFPTFGKAGSSHPPEYHLMVEYLIPKLEGLWEMSDGNLDKVVEQLKKPYFKKEMLLTSVSRGTITLVCANGAAVTFAQNDLSAEYPWGWVSNTHGYTEGATKAVEKPKKPSIFSGRSTTREKADPEALAQQVVIKNPPVIEAKADIAVASQLPKWTIKQWRPPSHLSRSERKDAYKSKIGYQPPGWEKNVAVNIYIDPQGKEATFSQMNKALGLETAALIKLANNPPRGKNIETDNIPQLEEKVRVASSAEQVSVEVLPIMSPKSRETFKDHVRSDRVKAIIAENADIINDPKYTEGLEAKFAPMTTQLGMKDASEFLGLPYQEMLAIGEKDVKALANMSWYFMLQAIKAGAFKKKVEAEVTAPPAKKPSIFSKAG